jgi:putative hydrolase of the HAD superfamily
MQARKLLTSGKKVNLTVFFYHLFSMQKIKAVFFDLDNTLIDFMRMKEESCKAAVKAMILNGLDMDEKEAFAVLMNVYFDLGLESDSAFTDFLQGVGQFNHKILAAALNSYLKKKATFMVPYPNVDLVLKKLNEMGVVTVIVTDAPKTKAYQRLLAMGIESYFRFVVGFEDTGNGKHTGLPLKLALDKLRKEVPDLVNSEVLMVGDSIERDIEPAKKLGLITAISKYGQIGSETSDSIDYELNAILDLLQVIQQSK